MNQNIEKNIPVIYKPKNRGDPFDHVGDTFRELLDMWKENGYCKVEESPDHQIWWGDPKNGILLFDRPTMEFMTTPYKIGLFGNPLPPRNSSFNAPWIFWGRSPRKLEEKIKQNSKELNSIEKDFNNRTIDSIFLGRIENNVQAAYRVQQNWKSCIQKFELVEGKVPKYNQDEYLDMLTKSKFGLCLRGYGPKCNREIEYLGLGVVPLLAPSVDVTYWDPLLEGIHYFRVGSPEDVSNILKTCTIERWLKMSIAGRKWYQRNCSTRGSFDTTLRILNSL